MTTTNKVKKNNVGHRVRKSQTSLSSANIKHPLIDKRIKVSLIEITPEMAVDILKTNHAENRNVKKRTVVDYADQMKKGLWRDISGEAVKISDTQKLIDGQHRLLAIIKSNIPIVMLVIENIPELSMSAIDDGAKRTLADSLKIHSIGDKKYNQKMVSSVIIALDVIRTAAKNNICLNDSRMRRNSSIVSTLEFSKTIPNLYETISDFTTKFNHKKINKIIPVGTASLPIFYLFNQIDQDFTYDFFKTMETGIPCDGLDTSSPSFLAYNAIINYKMKKINLRLTDYYEIFIWAMEKSKSKVPSTAKKVYRKKNFLITNPYYNSYKVLDIIKSLN
jgi:hypothetical protein